MTDVERWVVQKMSDVERQIGYSNIANVALKKIRKTKDITEKEKEKYKAFFKGKEGILLLKSLHVI